jgi:hypothetical protein
MGSEVEMWATAISTDRLSGRRIIFRYAEAFSPAFDRVAQPIPIEIHIAHDPTWEMYERFRAGMKKEVVN